MKRHLSYTAQRPLPPASVIGDLLKHQFVSQKISVISVGGPGGTGKSTFSKNLARFLGNAVVISLDDYKKPREHRYPKNIFGAHPEANHVDLINTHLRALKKGKPIYKPVYDLSQGRATETEKVTPCQFIIIDGEIATYKVFGDNIDFSIFIDSDWKTQLNTRIERDIELRGHSKEKAIATFLQSNLREFMKYGAESKKWADVHLFCHDDYHLDIESISEDYYDALSAHTTNISPIEISGLIVPLITPFAQDLSLDTEALITHLEFLSHHGIKRLLVNGTTGEFFSLSQKERKMLLITTRRFFPGLIIFQAGCDNMHQTLDEVRWAQRCGADALMVVAPYYFANAPQKGIIDYFSRIGDEVRIPYLLYNIPRHTQNPLTIPILEQVAHFGIKDSSADLSLIQHTPRYYIGSDIKMRSAYHHGALGNVSARANALPALYVAFEKALEKKDEEAATILHKKICTAAKTLKGVNEIAAIKYGVSKRLLNYPDRVRPPLIPLSGEAKREIDLVLAQFKDL